MTGTIFDIKEFTLHDGPGIRSTVFLKGCPLRCQWCHNPEGLTVTPQLMIKVALCTHCEKCLLGCTHEACKPFNRCLYACPKGLISVAGKEITSEDLATQLLKNADFLSENDGGITLSGGEPLMQPDFVLALVKELKGVHIAIQTSGFADFDTFSRVIDSMDYVMMDIKLADREQHKKYTGVDNYQIIQNFAYLQACKKPHVVRIPLIPGITNTTQNLSDIREIIGDSPVEFLPYNEMAAAKYPSIGMIYPLKI